MTLPGAKCWFSGVRGTTTWNLLLVEPSLMSRNVLFFNRRTFLIHPFLNVRIVNEQRVEFDIHEADLYGQRVAWLISL